MNSCLTLPFHRLYRFNDDEIVPVDAGVSHALLLFGLFFLLFLTLLLAFPFGAVANGAHHAVGRVDRRFQLFLQLGHEILGWDQDLRVLLHQLGEVVEEAVLRPQEIELEVPLLPILDRGEEGGKGVERRKTSVCTKIFLLFFPILGSGEN